MTPAALALAVAAATAAPSPGPEAAFAPVVRRYEAFFRTTPTRLDHQKFSGSPTREIFRRERYRLLGIRAEVRPGTPPTGVVLARIAKTATTGCGDVELDHAVAGPKKIFHAFSALAPLEAAQAEATCWRPHPPGTNELVYAFRYALEDGSWRYRDWYVDAPGYRHLDLRPFFGGYVSRSVYPELEANRAWADFARDVQAVPAAP